MECHHCKRVCIKSGRRKSGLQRWYCSHCNKYQQKAYVYAAYRPYINNQIKELTKESCGIRSIGRLLSISSSTVMRRILKLSGTIQKPIIKIGKSYEMDELKTYLKCKSNEKWVVYAIDRQSREVVDFRVGGRGKKTLGKVVETLVLSGAKKVYTDGYELYKYLLPKDIHSHRQYNINHIERKNLTLRTHLKRLGRKSICYSKNLLMLEACLKIYFWG